MRTTATTTAKFHKFLLLRFRPRFHTNTNTQHTHNYRGEVCNLITHTNTQTHSPAHHPLPRPAASMQRLYETIKLFSFPFLTLKRNAKKAEKEEGEQKGNYILRRRKYARVEEEEGRGRQKYYFPVTLGFVSVAMAHPLHYFSGHAAASKFCDCPRSTPPPYPARNPSESLRVTFCCSVSVYVCAELLRLIRVRNFYEKMPASST